MGSTSAEALRDIETRGGSLKPDEVEERYQARIEKYTRLRRFADDQKAKRFTYTYRLGIVRLWSIVEALVENVVVQHLKCEFYRKDILTHNKARGDLLEFFLGAEGERLYMLAEKILDKGDDLWSNKLFKLESFLSKVGLAGEMPKQIEKPMIECCEVRNIIVHRNSRIDGRFTRICPWIKANVGDLLEPNHRQFGAFKAALFWYLCDLDLRIRGRIHDAEKKSLKFASSLRKEVNLGDSLFRQTKEVERVKKLFWDVTLKVEAWRTDIWRRADGDTFAC